MGRSRQGSPGRRRQRGNCVRSCSHRAPDSPFLVHFVDAPVEGSPIALEHEEMRWVTTEELQGLSLAPADRAFADRMTGSPAIEVPGA